MFVYLFSRGASKKDSDKATSLPHNAIDIIGQAFRVFLLYCKIGVAYKPHRLVTGRTLIPSQLKKCFMKSTIFR